MNSHNTGAVTITKGKTATIAGFTNTVVANTDTMFLVMDKDSNGNYTYIRSIQSSPHATFRPQV